MLFLTVFAFLWSFPCWYKQRLLWEQSSIQCYTFYLTNLNARSRAFGLLFFLVLLMQISYRHLQYIICTLIFVDSIHRRCIPPLRVTSFGCIWPERKEGVHRMAVNIAFELRGTIWENTLEIHVNYCYELFCYRESNWLWEFAKDKLRRIGTNEKLQNCKEKDITS